MNTIVSEINPPSSSSALEYFVAFQVMVIEADKKGATLIPSTNTLYLMCDQHHIQFLPAAMQPTGPPALQYHTRDFGIIVSAHSKDIHSWPLMHRYILYLLENHITSTATTAVVVSGDRRRDLMFHFRDINYRKRRGVNLSGYECVSNAHASNAPNEEWTQVVLYDSPDSVLGYFLAWMGDLIKEEVVYYRLYPADARERYRRSNLILHDVFG